MKQYTLNVEQSRALYKKHKSKIEPKNCYMNIFHVLTLYPRVFQSGEWKIAYGYVNSIDGVYCRHCFILAGEQVIDPTLFASDRDNPDRKYFITRVFDNTEDYLAALDAEENYPALTTQLRNEDRAAQQWGMENGYLFIG